MAKSADTLADQKEMFETISLSEMDQRTAMLDDLRFGRLGMQWPAEIEKQRRGDNRPMLTINQMPAFIRQVVNDARQNRPQIKVKPVGSKGNVKTSTVFNGIIKNIEAVSKADIAYDTAMDFAVSAGIGYFRIDIEYEDDDTFDQVLRINRIPNVFSVFGDPFSKRADSADWNNSFLVDYVSLDEFQRDYKDAEEVDWQQTGYLALSNPWLSEEKIMICESWCREPVKTKLLKLSNGEIIEQVNFKKAKEIIYDPMGITVTATRDGNGHKVMQRLMTGAEILEETEWAGKYIPIIPVYGEEVNVEGRRLFKSLINNAKDAQRMFNYWRTTSTELVALAPRVPWVGEEGAFDVEGETGKWMNANRESYAYLQFKRGYQPPVRQQLDGGNAVGAMSEAMSANKDIQTTIGMHEASMGIKSNETSGKAIMARQHEGDVSTFHFIDNLNRAISHAGTVLVDLIPKVYTAGRIVRIIQPDGTQKAIKVSGTPNGAAGPLSTPGPAGGAMGLGGGVTGAPLTPPPTGMPPGPPPMGPPDTFPPAGGALPPVPQAPTPLDQGASYTADGADTGDLDGIEGVYDLGAGTYDVVIDTGKSFTTQREEFAAQATEFARAFPQALPVIGDILVKALDWPQSEEIAARLKAMMPPQAAGGIPPEIQKQIQDGMAKIQQLQQENNQLQTQVQSQHDANSINAHKADQEAQIKHSDLMIKAYDAETKRMAVATDVAALTIQPPKFLTGEGQ